MEVNPLVGKQVTAVFLAEDGKAIKFDLAGGHDPIVAHADGDCCSQSWIETVESPENLLGTVASVEDIEMPELPYDQEKFECLRFYGCKIVTDKGSCLIDYRNESNGYYGGSLEWPNGHFYGGVFGQNVSNEEWKKLA